MGMTTEARRAGGRLAALVAAALVLGAAADAATIPEPATVFYGQVIGTASAQPFVLTDGALEWTISRADGEETALRTSLFAFQDLSLIHI